MKPNLNFTATEILQKKVSNLTRSNRFKKLWQDLIDV